MSRPASAALFHATLALLTMLACQTTAPSAPAPQQPPDDEPAGGAGGSGGVSRDAAPARGGEGGTSPDAATAGGGAPGPDAAPTPDLAGAEASPVDTAPASARASQACGSAVAAPAEGIHNLMVGSRARRFFLRLPPDYDGKKPWPVIFAFHGAGNKNADWFDTHTGLRRENEGNAVLVFGESLYRPGSTSERSWQDEGQLPDNLAYIDATLAWLDKNVCIDPGRVFAAGQSSGAYFSQTLGCRRGDVFRAVASSDGGERSFSECRGHPGAFVRWRPAGLNGGADSVRVLAFWAKHNGCSDMKMATATPPCQAYQGCQHGAHLWSCADSGDHDWPAYMDRGVWTFFSQFK